VVLLNHVNTFSQNSDYSEGNHKFDNLAYMDAIKIYENVAKNGFKSQHLYSRIGDAYYLNGKYKSAVIWYAKLFKNYPEKNIDPIHLFRYAHGLKAVNDAVKGKKWLDKFYKRKGIPTQQHNKLTSLLKNKEQFTLTKLPLNSNHSDFAPFIYKSDLYFTSSRIKENNSKGTDTWTNLPFYDIYKSNTEANGDRKVIHLNKNINTPYNESSAVISKDGKTIYFTRNIAIKKEIQKFKIFKSTKKDGIWGKAIQLSFTKNDFLYAQPALNPTEDKLYFTSNLPDGYGRSDIYEVTILGENTFSKPKNLGKKINSFGRDNYPYIDQHGDLFYATDGKPGKGGLDIFKATFSKTDTIISTVNSKINSNYDDFSYTEDTNNGIVYFASNRDNSFDVDNIYSLKKAVTPVKKCTSILSGKIKNQKGNSIASATVMLLDINFEPIGETTTNRTGHYTFTIKNCNNNYVIRTHKDGFIAHENTVHFKEPNDKKILNIELDPYYQEVSSGHDLGKTLKLNPIYFDLDASKIRRDAKLELEKIVQAMLIAYPTIKIEIGAHTDSRATSYYNLILSGKRALATMNYLISRGVPASRISGKGYGETQLLNKCGNDVKCLEKEHQLNRRTEFIILNK